MCLNFFFKHQRAIIEYLNQGHSHNVGAAYTKDLSKNELAHVLLIGGTHNKQRSKDH